MEALYVLACGGLALLAALALMRGGGVAPRARVARRALHALDGLARSRAVTRCLGLPRVERACDAWRRVLAGRVPAKLDGRRCCALLLVAVCCAGLAGLLVARSALGLLAGVVVAMACVMLGAEAAARRHAQAVAEGMPATFRSLAASLAAGRTLPQALAYQGAHGREETREAFSRAALRMSCGYSSQEALDALVGELSAPDSELLVCALSVAHRTGSPLRGLFESSARMVEERQELGRALAVKTAQVRLSVRVVCALPAVLACVLVLLSPDYRAGIATAAGSLSVVVAVLLDVLAVLVIRRLVGRVL